jgi:hypothetical protein
MIDTNILEDKFQDNRCEYIYNNKSRDYLIEDMINLLRNLIIYATNYKYKLILTGHNPILSFKKNVLDSKNRFKDFLIILNTIAESDIDELIYISADTHNSQLCEFDVIFSREETDKQPKFNKTIKVKNYVTGNGGTELDKTKDNIIKNGLKEGYNNGYTPSFNLTLLSNTYQDKNVEVSNIKIKQFNATQYGFLSLEVDNNNTTKFEFMYNSD